MHGALNTLMAAAISADAITADSQILFINAHSHAVLETHAQVNNVTAVQHLYPTSKPY